MQSNSLYDRVLEAIKVFSRPPDGNKKEMKKAEKYLIEFEKTPDAWLISTQILETENLDKDIYVHAALILKKKLQFDFYQISAQDAAPLAEKIIGNDLIYHKFNPFSGYLIKFDDRPCICNLALALAVLYMHAFQTLGNILEGIANTLFKLDQKEYATLELLKVRFWIFFLTPSSALQK